MKKTFFYGFEMHIHYISNLNELISSYLLLHFQHEVRNHTKHLRTTALPVTQKSEWGRNQFQFSERDRFSNGVLILNRSVLNFYYLFVAVVEWSPLQPPGM